MIFDPNKGPVFPGQQSNEKKKTIEMLNNEIKMLEINFALKKIDLDETGKEVERIRSEYKEFPEVENGVLDYILAAVEYQKLSKSYDDVELNFERRRLAGERLSRQDMKNKKELISKISEQEAAVFEHCKKAEASVWKSHFFSYGDAIFMIHEIEYRRIKNNRGGKSDQDGYENFLEDLKHIKKAGKRMEYKVMWLLRMVLDESEYRDKVSVYHGTPIDDVCFYIDMIVRSLDPDNYSDYNIQIKGTSEDGDTPEYDDIQLEEAKKKVMGTNVAVFMVYPEELDLAVFGDKAGNFKSSYDKKVLGEIAEHCKLKLFKEKSGAEQKKSGEKTRKAKIIEKYAGKRDFLLSIGYLNENNCLETNAILEARKRFIQFLEKNYSKNYEVISEMIKNFEKKQAVSSEE